MFKLSFQVEGVEILNRAFHRVGERLDDLTPIWENVQRSFWKIESENFKSQNARGASGTWKPLSRDYARRKAQRYGVQPILRATGRLEASLTSQTGDTLLFKDKREFGIGTSVPYARYHQTGGGKLPKRPVIDFSEQQKRDLSKGIQRDLLDALKRDARVRPLEIK